MQRGSQPDSQTASEEVKEQRYAGKQAGRQVPASNLSTVPASAGHQMAELTLTLGTFSLAQEGMVVT
jgi:hypothetical protein